MTDRPVQIEITQEMIEAGVKALRRRVDADLEEDARFMAGDHRIVMEVVGAVFREFLRSPETENLRFSDWQLYTLAEAAEAFLQKPAELEHLSAHRADWA